ncbi:MAG TPA: hypothetical protein VL588_05745 [Bdellovibrionota bacterium]|jgi:hypothetical protein|nr:hypothetical protein [Bdellovibrionota bacterium]
MKPSNSVRAGLLAQLFWAAFVIPPGAHWEPRTYQVGKLAVPSLYWKEGHLVVSAECRRPDGSVSCEAVKAVDRVNAKGLKMPPGGADPGAIACIQQAHGQVVVARTQTGGEAGFCAFEDGSLISTGSLDFHAHRNAGF